MSPAIRICLCLRWTALQAAWFDRKCPLLSTTKARFQSEAALPIQVEDLNRPFNAPATTTSPGIKIIAQMILSRFALTQGILPKK
jgi:hypothetical protein